MTKRNLLTLLLALAMVLTMLPMTALAADEAAEVNGQTYQSLAEAVAAANDGDTITLLKNITELRTL